jgi:hypothetical protein
MPAKDEEKKPQAEKPKAPKRHLHRIIVEHYHDGKHSTGYAISHEEKEHPSDQHAMPPKPMAVAKTPEEAGEHVTDQLQQAYEPEPGAGGGGAPEEQAPADGEGAPEE